MRNMQNLEVNLKRHFQISSFRKGQKEIITDVMQGKDVLGILPTGSGKSLCYQLPAKLLPGVTIVVSPLISLMTDQVKQLKAKHFKNVIALNSFMDYETRQHVLHNLADYKLIYVSPELLQHQYIQQHLKGLSIDLFVIDEAHCISQWGHEFRTDYLKLAETIQRLGQPPVLALSATAPVAVQADIIKSLEKPNMIKHIYPMDRKNIAFSIQKTKHDAEKMSAIKNLLARYRVPTLIYFSSRKATEAVTKSLLQSMPTRRIAFYHGGMEAIDRFVIQQQFMSDQLDVVCCTSAFGMGIDKSNIRLIIHYHFPPQLEAFIQEIGRAGRDGETSLSVLLYSEQDVFLPQHMIEQELPSEAQLNHVFQYLATTSNQTEISPQLRAEEANKLQVNDIQWRFIHYQLEKNDIIKNNKIVYQAERWQQVLQTINTHQLHRRQLKQKKLFTMIRWLQETDCLRKTLYKHFQSGYEQPDLHCCSNCGLLLDDWQPEQKTNHIDEPLDWARKLKQLLIIGEADETK